MKKQIFKISDKIVLTKTANQITVGASLNPFDGKINLSITLENSGQTQNIGPNMLTPIFTDNYVINNSSLDSTLSISDGLKSSIATRYGITYI